MRIGEPKGIEWFTDRIGKRVFRNKTKCNCASCTDTFENGVMINDKDHAGYLWLVSNELGIRYTDEKIVNTTN